MGRELKRLRAALQEGARSQRFVWRKNGYEHSFFGVFVCENAGNWSARGLRCARRRYRSRGRFDDSVAKASSELFFRGTTFDSGTNPTQCTVGGTQMHCCPEQQQNFLNSAIVGVNLQTNSLRCAQLTNANFNAPFASTARRTINGVSAVACPPGSVMVGFHFTQQKAACVTVSASPLTERTTSGSWDGGTYACYAFPPPNTFFTGEAVSGISAGSTTPMKLFCAK
jgi:hypothetical protein